MNIGERSKQVLKTILRLGPGWTGALLLALGGGPSFAQVKYEKESRIKPEVVPPMALSFIEPFEVKGKVKWYEEEGAEHRSFEAKFKRDGKKYSVEFDTLGQAEDVEVTMDREEVPGPVMEAILMHLRKECATHRIVKVQIQYTGNRADLLAGMQSPGSTPGLTTRYELTVKCKTGKQVDLYEYLFSDEGAALSTSRIIFKSSSHLEY